MMPGLLDMFDDPQQAGLLNAAAQMLAASGPSTMPTSFGQIMAKGVGGFQQGVGLADQRAQQAQARQLNDLKLRDGESDLKNQEMLRARQAQIQAELMSGGQYSTPTAPMPAPQSAGAMFQGAMSGQDTAPQAPAAPQAAPQPTNPNEAAAARLMQEAQVYAKYGDFDGANKRYEAAIKLQPKYSTDFRMAMGADGQPHNYVLADNGTWKDTGLGVKPDVTEVDLGGTKQFVDKNRVTPGQIFKKTMSPDTAANTGLGYARLNWDKSQADSNQDEAMDPLAIRMTAQQYLAGDTSALQNFGRGAQGAKNLNAVRLEIAKQATAAGMNGADIAGKVAEFGGTKAGMRTAGTRSASIEIAANEVSQLAPLALDASSKVARSGFKPFGNAQIMFDSHTNDPNLRQFAMANQALVNAYGQAMARGGSATVSDKEHAEKLLSTTFDQPSYAAAVEQLKLETKAAQAAPKAVRKELSASVSGRHDAPAASPAPKSVLKGQVMDGYRFKGGNPSDRNAWEPI